MDISEWLPQFMVSAESDPDLLDYFLKTQYLDELMKTEKWLLLGRKGTGKTAIYEYFIKSPKDTINGYNAIAFNFKNYPWVIHQIYKESMESDISVYSSSWKYLIVVELLSKLLEIKEKKGEPINEDLKKVKKLFLEIYGNPTPSLVDIIKGKLIRLSNLSLPTLHTGNISFSVGEISFEEIQEDEKLKQKLRSNASTFLTFFSEIFIKNCQDEKFIILIDQLDENWAKENLEEYKRILISLIHVCKDFNQKHRDRSLKIVIFLRTDIYKSLEFNDWNKIYQDSAIIIKWDENSLNTMFNERIKKYKPSSVTLNLDDKTNSIFIDRIIRHRTKPLNYILRRTFFRPRDLIVFINKIREVHDREKSTLFTKEDIYSADPSFSENMYNELMDEWKTQKPEITDYLAILQNIGVQIFNYSEYADKYKQRFANADKSQMENSLKFLLENSIVGQKISIVWEYYCINPNISIDFSKEFRVNSGLKSRLTLIESRTT